MRQWTTMGAMALGISMGWACDGVSTKVFDSGTPDASAQGDAGADGGGERPAPRVIEVECVLPAESGAPKATIGPDQATEAELMAAGYWGCGLTSTVAADEYPDTRCGRLDSVTIDAGTATIICGPNGDADGWRKSTRVVVVLP